MRFEGEGSNNLNTQMGIAERMCVDLQLSDGDRDSVIARLQGLSEMEHTPKTIVAGVISLVLGGQIPRVSQASGVSTVSIRKIVDKLRTVTKGST
jgi:hypothetical protein